MLTRGLGRTGYRVSEIGFGAWGLGGNMWLGGTDEEGLRALGRLRIEFGASRAVTVFGDAVRLVARSSRRRARGGRFAGS